MSVDFSQSNYRMFFVNLERFAALELRARLDRPVVAWELLPRVPLRESELCAAR